MRIGPGGRLLSVVVVAILTLPIMQGGPVSAQFQGGPDNSSCGPAPFGPATFVEIDVKPGTTKNVVNVNSGGLLEIAICSEKDPTTGTTTFNAPAEVWVKCGPTASPSCVDKPGTSTPTLPLPASSPNAGAFPGNQLSLHSCGVRIINGAVVGGRDVNGDGLKDLVCHFFINLMNLAGFPDETVALRGCCKTPEFGGFDSINISEGK